MMLYTALRWRPPVNKFVRLHRSIPLSGCKSFSYLRTGQRWYLAVESAAQMARVVADVKYRTTPSMTEQFGPLPLGDGGAPA